MARTPPETVHVVQRLNWVRHRMWGPQAVEGRLVRIPGVVRVGSFATEDEALVECQRREEDVRHRVNPFLCGGPALHFQTSFAEEILRDWLLDADIEPPAAGDSDWVEWWRDVVDELDEVQWAHVWKALDRLTFHEVVAKPARPVVYVISAINWVYNDEDYDPSPEGGKSLRAFRSREKAEAECDRLEEAARRDRPEFDDNGISTVDGFGAYDYSRRLAHLDPFTSADEIEYDEAEVCLFYEVVEVELADLTGQRA
jgi:hypothetical protein